MTRCRLPPLAAVLVLVALLSSGCLGGGSRDTGQPRTGSKLWGAATPHGYRTLSGLDSFERVAGKRVSLFMYFESWAQFRDFDAGHAQAVRRRGALPILSWEPWDWRFKEDQPRYRLRALVRGDYDPYVRRWARQIAAWGKPILVRFAHEMNGDWYPWSGQSNGNAPGDYVAAWRHVHRIFADEEATNVQWVWAPNRIYDGSVPLKGLYPGDRYVDWIGIDAYNRRSVAPLDRKRSLRELIAPTLKAVRALGDKPILITETAAAEEEGDKAAWIRNFFADLGRIRDIRGFVWFNFRKGSDWRIDSSPAARSAFAAGVSSALYREGRGS